MTFPRTFETSAHRFYRRKTAGLGTHPGRMKWRKSRGYSLVELGVSILVFSLIAGIVTVAVGRSQMTLANNKFARLLEGRLSGLVEQVGSNDYVSLVHGTFEKPKDPGCPEDIKGSCVMLGTRDFYVDWTVTPACLFDCLDSGDLLASSVVNFNEISQQIPYALLITASVELPDESPVSYSKMFINPAIGADGYGLVRVSFANTNYSGPVYLVASDRQVLSGSTARNGVALLSGLVDTCTVTSPCALALSSSGSTRRGDLTLDYATAVGVRGNIVLTMDGVSEVGATIVGVSPVRASLLAVNADGRRGYAADINSICQGLRIPTEKSAHVVAVGCNSLQESHITWETYFPTGNPLVEIAIPVNMPLSVVSVTAEDPCIIPEGQLVYEQNSWVAAETCGNYSWGDPNLLKYSKTGEAVDVGSATFYRNETSLTAIELIWDGSVSESRASGAALSQLWGSPETRCSNCDRIVMPVLVGPRLGKYRTLSRIVEPGESFFLDLDFTNSDNPSVEFQVKVTHVPYGLHYLQDPDCEIDCEGEEVNYGDMVVTEGGELSTVPFEFIADDYFESDYLGLEISNAYDTQEIKLNLIASGDDNAPLEMYTSPLVVEQGGSYSAEVLLVGVYGEGVTGAGDLITLDDDGAYITLSSVEEIGEGWYTVTGSALNVAAGNYAYTLSVGYVQAEGIALVKQKAGSISGQDLTLTQNGTVTMSLAAEDLSGAPMQGANLWVDVRTPELLSVIGVYPTVRGCSTGESGSCTVQLSAESSVKTGTYIVRVFSEDLTAQNSLEVTGVLSYIEYPSVVNRKGSVTGVRVRALDARGEPLSGVTLSLASPVPGVTFSATESDDLGYADVSIQTTVNTPSGINTLSLVYGSGGASLVFVANNVPATISANRVVLEQGSSAITTVYVYDALGAPVVGATVDTYLSELSASGRSVTDATGAARILVAAGATAKTGVRYMEVTTTDGVSAKIRVQVILGVNGIAAAGEIKPGVTAPLTWTLYSGSGSVMSGVPYSVTRHAEYLVLESMSGVTDADGRIVMNVGTTGKTVKGFHDVVFEIAGKSFTSKVAVN